MKFKGKLFLTLLAGCFAAGGFAGCGGFQGSHSISPATFFLPGLVQNTPGQPEETPVSLPPDSTAVSSVVAQ